MLKKNLVILSFLTLIGFSSCEHDESKTVSFAYQQNFDFDNGPFNYNTIIENPSAHSGNKICRVDSGFNYGFGYSYFLPDSLFGKEIVVNLDAWVRSGDLTNNADIIMSAFVGDSCKLWLGFGAKEFIKEPNKWTNVKGRFNLSPAITSAENLKITVMAHNIDAKSYFDVDDLKIMFTEEDENN
ncbi:MAG TPA: hypothetical protein PLC65_02860 [Bacteroidia bacterium]|nr:hypothetical protein [Bacteroidia bacterium]